LDALAGLYIHVPFCTSVCPYCDFAVTIAGDDRRAAWEDGIVLEAQMYADGGLRFDTVYFGGGTPSSLGPSRIHRILDGLRIHLAIEGGAAVFLEANPEDVTAGNARAWRDLGVNFVSLGVQSFDDTTLGFLGRAHTGDRAREAVEILLGSGFETVSIDLIYGFEGQTADGWRRELARATSLAVQHLSCYQLTIHGGTVFGRRSAHGEMVECAEETQAELFFLTHRWLADAGYQGYEVSNFASSPDHRSRHNSKYWKHLPYLGLGPSAHSFAGGRRWWNRRKLRLWQRAVNSGLAPVEDGEQPSLLQLAFETLMLGLRTSEGVDLERLRHRFGIDLLATNALTIDRLTESGHLHVVGRFLRPTLSGLALADTITRSLEIGQGDDERRSTVR
jgi:oxygen-independent coproporphyrinogen-3 oxidase